MRTGFRYRLVIEYEPRSSPPGWSTRTLLRAPFGARSKSTITALDEALAS